MSPSQNIQEVGLLYCDGASKGNPGPAGWGYVLSAHCEVREAGGASDLATNNQMELRALEQALGFLVSIEFSGKLRVYLDSQYVLEGAKTNLSLWKKRSWMTSQRESVKNRDIWEQIDSHLSQLKKNGVSFEWNHVRGHSGIPGNERCDEIASQFAEGNLPSLYVGPAEKYEVSLDHEIAQIKNYSSPVYLSLIDGKLYRDSTWPACEARVRGRTGSKYKKVKNSIEEAEILKKWNFNSKSSS